MSATGSDACARVAVFDRADQPFRMVDVPLPRVLAEGEMLVKLSLATICGSDLHTYAGRRQEPTPCVLGHEGVGRVILAGPGREVWRGRRISWTLADSCGACPACVRWELPQKCARLFKYGHAPLRDGSGLHGTYASHILLRRGTHVVEIPDALPDSVAASANCSLATMAYVTEHLPRPCEVAVIQGAGLLGLHGFALLRAAGVPRVIVVDVDAARLTVARALGAETMPGAEIPGGMADLVIEAAGVPAVIADGLRLLRPGGHYRLVGLVHPDSALTLTGEALIRGCVTLQGFHNYAPRHLEQAVAFLRVTDSRPWESLVSPPLPLERLDEAFALATTKRWARVGVTV